MHIHIYFMPPFIVWPRNNSNCWLWAFACLMHLINIKPCFGRECGRHSSPRKSPLCSIVFVGQPPPPPPKSPKKIQNSVADTSLLLPLLLSHLHNFICNTCWAFLHHPKRPRQIITRFY